MEQGDEKLMVASKQGYQTDGVLKEGELYEVQSGVQKAGSKNKHY